MYKVLFVFMAVSLSNSVFSHEYAQKVRNTDIVGAESASTISVSTANCRQIQLVSLTSAKGVGASIQKLADTSLVENGFVVEDTGDKIVILSKPFHTQLDTDLYLEKAKKSVPDAFAVSCS